MDAGYASEVERALAVLKVAIASAATPKAEEAARKVERFVREYLGKAA